VKALLLFCLLSVAAVSIAQNAVADSSAVKRSQKQHPQQHAADTLTSDGGKNGTVSALVVIDTTDYRSVIERTLLRHSLLNADVEPVVLISKRMSDRFNNTLFFTLLLLILFFAFLRYFYERYYHNLFRVFFNTTLRQSQLTDQLLQSKQISLLFNVLFVCSGGLYIYVVLRYFKLIESGATIKQAGIFAVVLSVLYGVKMLSLRFTGWLTGFKKAADTYIFIIFLINKILGILLLPFIVIIAFGTPVLQYPVLLISLILIMLMLLMRFLRSYGLLRREIKVSGFHFFVYMTGVELLPLLLIYKTVLIYFGKIG